MSRVLHKLVEVYMITEIRDGAVYKTERTDVKRVPVDSIAPKGYIYAPMSTSYDGPTMRMVNVDE